MVRNPLAQRPSGLYLYQLEVKYALVQLCFNPANGWRVTVDVDPMERARGGKQAPDKADRAEAARAGLEALGVTIGRHPQFGPVDLVADHPELGLRLLEVEGESTRQTEQAVYSALGQLLMSMKLRGPQIRYGLAVPHGPLWTRQLRKLPPELTKLLCLDLYSVDHGRVEITNAGETIPDYRRA